MAGGRRAYKIGYAFEKRVQKLFNRMGHRTIRIGMSKECDLIVLPVLTKSFKVHSIEKNKEVNIQIDGPLFVECKKAKYISTKERADLETFKPYGRPLLAWPDQEQKKEGKRSPDIIISDLHYKELARFKG